MKKKSFFLVICIMLITLLAPVTTVQAKAKPKLAVKSKTMTVGQSYKLKLKNVSSKAKVKWKTSKKSVVTITKKKGNTVTLKAKKKGTATITATYKKKTYKCKIKVKAKKKVQETDKPVLNATDVTLYYLSDAYKNDIQYNSNHIREYQFKVSGTKKEVKKWELSGEDADYFTITSYGLVKTQWGPSYEKSCVTATVVATLEDGRTLKAVVRAYSELNIYIDSVFTSFEKQYITTAMTQKEKVEKAAWYIGATSDYEAQDSEWYHIFTKHKGDCSASRYALQYMCEHMGIKAVACRDIDYHGETLVKADGVFYMVITGYNEPKPRKYTIYEMTAEGLEKLVKENNINLAYFN